MANDMNVTGVVSRPFYTIRITLKQLRKNSVTDGCLVSASPEDIDLTPFINRVEIVKSISVLVPVLVMDFAPSVIHILQQRIIEEDYFHIEIKRVDVDSKSSEVVLRADVFIDDFDLQFSLAQKHLNDEQQPDIDSERTRLTLFCKPIYFNRLLKQIKNEIIDVKQKFNVMNLVEYVMNENWGKDFAIFIKPNSEDNTGFSKYVFDEDRILIHKTTVLDYLRYIQQRYGLYPQATLFYTDFVPLSVLEKTTASYNSKLGAIFLKSFKYVVKEETPSFYVKFMSDKKTYTTNMLNGRPIAYVSREFSEQRQFPERLMKSKSKVNFMTINRENLYDVDKQDFFSPEMQEFVKTRKTPLTPRDYLVLEKTLMTNTIRNNEMRKKKCGQTYRVPTMFQVGYFGDQFSTFQFVKIVPPFWFKWNYISTIGCRVDLISDVPLYTQRFDSRVEGSYMFFSTRLSFTREAGGPDVWLMKPEITLARQ